MSGISPPSSDSEGQSHQDWTGFFVLCFIKAISFLWLFFIPRDVTEPVEKSGEDNYPLF